MVHGDLDGYELMCPLHGARFDIRNGAALSLPAVRGVDLIVQAGESIKSVIVPSLTRTS